MHVNKYRDKQSIKDISASMVSNFIEICKGPTLPNAENKLSNINGDLYWEDYNLTSAIIEGSKWSISNNKKDIFRDSNIGIKTTSPNADLEVNGKIKTKELQIGSQSGFLKSINGNIQTTKLSLNDVDNVNIISLDNAQFLFFDGKNWLNKNLNDLSHSIFKDLDSDSHPQYLNEKRHQNIEHIIPSLDVNNLLVVNSNGIFFNAPVILKKEMIFNDKLIVDELELKNLNGVLIANKGKISTGVTTSNIPEGKNLYYSEERVINLIQGNYLALNGSNIGNFSGFNQFVEGLDADKLDGKDACEFAPIKHYHSHNDLIEYGTDDHHKQRHYLTGADHIVNNGNPGQFLKIVDKGFIDFSDITVDDIPNIPFEKIGNGEISGENIFKLRNIKGNIQEQLDDKSNIKHKHKHSDLEDVDEDNHKQYLNKDRAIEFLKEINTDFITEGKNLYYSENRIREFSDINYLRLDGLNLNKLSLNNVCLDINVKYFEGFSANDFAKINHVHNHKDIVNQTPNDHHNQKHNIIGEDHIFENIEFSTFLKVSNNGKLIFEKLSRNDMPFNIPIKNIENGEISLQEFSYLSGVKSNLQEQIETKAFRNHIHSHADLIDKDKDNYIIYYNKERLEKWFLSKTLDDIKNGINNKHLSLEALKELIKFNNELCWEDDKIALNYDTNIFDINGGKLSTIQDISLNGNVSFASVNVGNILIKNGSIGINGFNPQAALNVAGKACFDCINVKDKEGIAKFKDGILLGNAKLSDLWDVNMDSSFDECIMVYRNNNWVAVDPKQIISIPDFSENFNAETHALDNHNINQINVNDGIFLVEKNNIKLGSEENSNIFVYGELDIKGNLKINGSVAIDSLFARDSIDIGINRIVAGPSIDIYNRFNLFNESDNSIILELYDEIKFQFNSIDTSDGKIASFNIINDGIIQFNAFTNEELAFSVGNDASISFLSGGLKIFTISNNDYIGMGTPNPILPIDTRNFLGIADAGNKPTNWLIVRTDMPMNGPVIAFPQNKQLKIGTYDNYSINGVWNELIVVDEKSVSFNSNNINIKGQINQNITRKKILEVNNHNVNIDGSNFIKFTSATELFMISGFENGVDGRKITLMNGTNFDLVILSENANSLYENRIFGTEDVIIKSKEIVNMIYDIDEKRWILLT